ncbi:hypothetical protein BDR07DRAFT_1489197 [Suillus spraguei]|nr:hypothetical protein BDR07DRAFT_1496911 [Suillus spraguei]KAG2353706.1 hypothetical protein BDR07DRAFT_1495789 [Suillus spraguei]KAG2358672.1 hypothetical protein BDR07DRAFT_1489197 [Suillus spraguei]
MTPPLNDEIESGSGSGPTCDFPVQPPVFPDSDFDRLYQDAWNSAIAAAGDGVTTSNQFHPSQVYPDHPPHLPSPYSEEYLWETLTRHSDIPSRAVATAAHGQAAYGSHEVLPQVGVASSDVHPRPSAAWLDDSLPQSKRYTPYKIPDRLTANRNRSRHLTHDDDDDDGMGQHAGPSRHNSTAHVPPQESLKPSLPISTVVVPSGATGVISSSSPIGKFGLEDLKKVKSDTKELLKRSMFDHSFLLSTEARKKEASNTLTTTVAKYNSVELTEWSNGEEALKNIATIANSMKTMMENIKDIVRITVLCYYNLHEALVTQPKAVVASIVQHLLANDTFLNGLINVGGQDVDVIFGNIAVRHFVRHVLFNHLNYQQYIDATRNLKRLFSLVGTFFEWALQELSTGVFLASKFDLTPARTTYEEKLAKTYEQFTSDVRDALITDIYTVGGQPV